MHLSSIYTIEGITSSATYNLFFLEQMYLTWVLLTTADHLAIAVEICPRAETCRTPHNLLLSRLHANWSFKIKNGQGVVARKEARSIAKDTKGQREQASQGFQYVKI